MACRRRTLLVALLAGGAGCGSAGTTSETRTAAGPESRRATPTPGTETGTAPEPEPSAPSGVVTVVNDADEDRYVTVAVDREGETALVESRTVRRGTAVTLDGRVPPGTYRTVVETASGIRDQFDWRVTPALTALRVRLTTHVRFSRPALCDPACVLAVGGESRGYPDGGFDPRGRRAGSELRVYNPGEREERLRVRVADGEVLDYRYRVPPAVLLTIPVPQRAGETAVRIDVADDRVRAFDWAMETDPVRYVVLGQ